MTTTPKIIGLTGPTGAGKSMVAKILANTHGYRIAPMAGPLKQMLIAGGLSHEDVYGEYKERPSDILGGQTPRHAMQTLGTEWGRDLIHPNIWVNMWRAAYDKLGGGVPRSIQPIVADDVRFENEADLILDLGGIVVEVARPGCSYSAVHRSEAGLPAINGRIHNTKDITHLRGIVSDMVAGRPLRV